MVSERLLQYLDKRIRQLHAEGLTTEQIFEQLTAVSGSKKLLRNMIHEILINPQSSAK